MAKIFNSLKEHTIVYVFVLLIVMNVLAFLQVWKLNRQNPQPESPSASSALTPAQMEDKIKLLEEQIKVAGDNAKNEVRSEYFFYLTITTLIGAAIGVVGGQEFLKQKSKDFLHSLWEGSDPFGIPIYIPNRDFDQAKDHLRRIGFRLLIPYYPDPETMDVSLLRGIIVYPIRVDDDKDEDAKNKAIADLVEFFSTHRLEFSDRSLGCVIYTSNRLPLEKMFEVLPLTVTANMPITIATQIMAITRAMQLGKN
jgi:hypothetical protein